MFKRIIKEAMPILMICIIGEVAAGIILFNLEKFLSVLPGIVILIPIVMGTRGNILGIFASRLTSALHLGTIKPVFFRNKPLAENAFAALFLSVFIAILSGIAAHYTSFLFGFKSAGILNFVLIVLIASFLSDLTLIFISTGIAFISFIKGIDPDNILLPATTTISDFLSCFFLVLAAKIVL